MTTARNAACPCGSGQKFKRCCGAPDAMSDSLAPDAETGEALGSHSSSRDWLPIILFAVAIGAGVGVGTLREAIADGLAVGLALSMGIVIFLMARNPPQSTGRGGGTAINFGLNQKGKSNSSSGPPNRRQRRRK
jgi:hypothetical protein